MSAASAPSAPKALSRSVSSPALSSPSSSSSLAAAMEVLPHPPPADGAPARGHYLDEPAHAVRDSLFHSGTEFNDFRGFINLALLCLVAACVRVVVENLSKYGILIDPLAWAALVVQPRNLPCLWSLLNILAAGWIAVYTERLAARGFLSARAALALHSVNIVLELALPVALVLRYHPTPVASFVALFNVIIVWMKLISYAAVNHHERTRKAKKPAADADEKLVRYPHNVTLGNALYFLFAPTLCYEINFPRTGHVRRSFVVRRLGELVLFGVIMLALGQQWIAPTVHNSLSADTTNVAWVLQRVLKLALPNIVLWIMGFYLYFHAYLNLCGELLRFGDRQFYRDWWNARTVAYFWRNWNIPVHKWLARHVYRPLTQNGWGRTKAQLAVFFLSAVFHEVLVSVPLGMFRWWAFAGMMVQLPFILVSDRYLAHSVYGNMAMWTSLLVGHPIAILLYVEAYLAASGAL